uniref:Uncharacterized protein n=1 Tax=Aegilops tauschii subsp. strangulata TaxID=200361 RepID=A0A453LU20_AEGTS
MEKMFGTFSVFVEGMPLLESGGQCLILLHTSKCVNSVSHRNQTLFNFSHVPGFVSIKVEQVFIWCVKG